jgi:succinate dehydrogenase flavin-adding protein (antitoxin of CptAB toxin-antitoxin module)
MKELDLLLSRYVRERYLAAPAGQQAAFEALLGLPDPEIADLLLGYGAPTDPDLVTVIRELSGGLRVYPGTARQSVP